MLSDVSNPYLPQLSPESKPLSSMREEDFVRSEETAERFQDLGEITEEEVKKELSLDSKLRVISIDDQQGVKFFHKNAPSMDR